MNFVKKGKEIMSTYINIETKIHEPTDEKTAALLKLLNVPLKDSLGCSDKVVNMSGFYVLQNGCCICTFDMGTKEVVHTDDDGNRTTEIVPNWAHMSIHPCTYNFALGTPWMHLSLDRESGNFNLALDGDTLDEGLPFDITEEGMFMLDTLNEYKDLTYDHVWVFREVSLLMKPTIVD